MIGPTAAYPLFCAYPELAARLPRLALGEFPTPVERLEGTGGLLGAPLLFVKRDDLSSPLYGGNKVRKLELLLAEALRRGRRSVVTVGAAGSNHVLATLLHAARLGLQGTALLIDQPNAAYVRRNLLLDRQTGARMVHVPGPAALLPLLAWNMRGGALRGTPAPFFITAGGSDPLSCLGYVAAALELRGQVEEGLLPEPDFVFVAAGTLGTAAGLELGLRLAGMRTRVTAVAVVERWACNRSRWAWLVNRASMLMRRLGAAVPRVKVRPRELLMVQEMLGEGYARFTPEGMEAVQAAWELDGLELDGTYTGKAFAAMLRALRDEGLKRRCILFWNTLSSTHPEVEDEDYRRLPPAFHRYFEQPLQSLEETLGFKG